MKTVYDFTVKDMDEKEVTQPLKPVIRKATEEDGEKERRNREKEREAFKICKEKIVKHDLPNRT